MATKATLDPHACPDPSVHEKTSALQDQASKAALYVTGSPSKVANTREIQALGPDGKLSSAGAAASLKHAQPHELPSFPVVGIDTEKSGFQAATIANANQKPFEHWKPGLSSSAGKAALLAHKDGGKVDLWQPTASDSGFAAAGAALGTRGPQLDYGYTDDGRKKALLAATMSVSGRSKAESPAPSGTRYPDAANSAYNALNAATVANRTPSTRSSGRENVSTPTESPRMSSAALEAARVQHTQNVPREMYGDNPQAFEYEEKRREDALRAAGASFFKSPEQEEHSRKTALAGASVSMTRQMQEAIAQSEAEPPKKDIKAEAKNYLQLQDAAHKAAQDRIAKLDPDGLLAQREHYGYSEAKARNRLSVRRKGGRSSTEDDSDEDDVKDEIKAGRIRHQMSVFNKQVEDVDTKKRQADRKSLMDAAQKSVQARMKSMDKELFEEHGKVTPSIMSEWEAKARERANLNSEKRLEHHGMVHIGGGKYMDNTEVNEIAAARMQPTLDEINDSAERQRARDEEIRLDVEQRKRESQIHKGHERDTKAELKRQKETEKEQAKFEKMKEKERKAEDKEHQKVQKRLQKEEEKQKKQETKDSKLPSDGKTEQDDEERKIEVRKSYSVRQSEKISEDDAPKASHDDATQETVDEVPPASKPERQAEESAGVQRAKADATEEPAGVPKRFDGKDSADEVQPTFSNEGEHSTTVESPSAEAKKEKRRSQFKGFFGKFKRGDKRTSKAESTETRQSVSADKDVAGAEEPKAKVDKGKGRAASRSPSISSLSSADEQKGKLRDSVASNDKFEEAKDKMDDDNLAAPSGGSLGRSSKEENRNSKFTEEV